MLSTIKNELGKSYQNIFNLLSNDPWAIIDAIKQVRELPSTIRDGIFFDCLESYILNISKYDEHQGKFVENNLKRLGIALADVSPNQESGYVGDVERLHEYSKRIIKLIDDCGTVQKAVYLANISRAFVDCQINKREFFKLAQCLRMLTEEDLLFLKENINGGIVTEDGEYIDDFRGLGLIYEVDGGFAYSQRAFRLLKYALEYEQSISIPESFPERIMMSAISDKDIDKLFDDVKEVDNRTRWGAIGDS